MQEYALNGISSNYQGYNNEYLEGAYLSNTASFSYIQFRCNTVDQKTIPLPDVFTSANTVYQHKNVVCYKDIFDEVKSRFKYPL